MGCSLQDGRQGLECRLPIEKADFSIVEGNGDLGGSSGSSKVTERFHVWAGVDLKANTLLQGVKGRALLAQPSSDGQGVKRDDFATKTALGFRFK